MTKNEITKLLKRINLYTKAHSYSEYKRKTNYVSIHDYCYKDEKQLAFQIREYQYGLVMNWVVLSTQRTKKIESFEEFKLYLNNPLGGL